MFATYSPHPVPDRASLHQAHVLQSCARRGHLLRHQSDVLFQSTALIILLEEP
jgi:hypothetical protein